VKWLALKFVNLIGWRVVGEMPDDPKMVIIAAPHTSNWDYVLFLFLLSLLLSFSFFFFFFY